MIRIALQFAPTCSVGSLSALVYILAWHQPDDKSLPEVGVMQFIEAYVQLKTSLIPNKFAQSIFTDTQYLPPQVWPNDRG